MTKIEQDDWLTDELMQRARKLILDIDGVVSQGTVYAVSRALHLAEKSGEERVRAMSEDRVSYDRKGKLDEIVGTRGAHLERLGNGSWFLSIAHADLTETALWFKSRDLPELIERRGN